MATKKEASVEVMEVKTGRIDFCILGKSPIILARMTEKAKQELLMPKGRKSAAERAGTLKHNPFEEFRAAPYLSEDPQSETLLCHIATAFKQSARGAALDIPGSTKSQIGRLVWVEGERVPLYGVPRIFMAITRSADMNKTPDVRTRCIVPEWACKLSVSFVKPIIKEQVIVNLFAAAGLMQGVGDWRPGKGSGNYGQFELVDENNADFQRITQQYRREAQQAAMDRPVAYDRETEEMLEWFSAESKRRGFEVVA